MEIPSRFKFGINFLGSLAGWSCAGFRLAAKLCSLQQDVTRHARSHEKQRSERDE
jgi:hypothetical protein